MARPKKQGLDYFPFDVDFFEDDKISAVFVEFGIKGEIAAIKLLCAVYRNGYFIEWRDTVRIKLLRVLPGISPELLEQIVRSLVRWGFFDKALFDSANVLTSHGIQTRYFSSKRQKPDSDMPYLLVSATKTPVIAAETQVIAAETPQREKEREEKEKISPIPPSIKEKEREEKKRGCGAADAAALLDERKKVFYNSLVPFVDKYGREMVRDFFDYWTEPNKSRSKMRFELERTWDVSRRLGTWSRHDDRFGRYPEKTSNVNDLWK